MPYIIPVMLVCSMCERVAIVCCMAMVCYTWPWCYIETTCYMAMVGCMPLVACHCYSLTCHHIGGYILEHHRIVLPLFTITALLAKPATNTVTQTLPTLQTR